MNKRRISLETFDAHVSAIYDAASDPALWNDYLILLTESFNSCGAILRFFDSQSHYPGFSLTHGYDEQYTEDYRDHFYQVDSLARLMMDMPEGAVVNRNEVMPDKQFIKMEIYNDLMRKRGIHHILGSHFIQQDDNSARFGVHRSKNQAPFSAEDKQFLSLLVPHMQRAFNISRHIQTIQVQWQSTTDLLDQLHFGVILVDSMGRPTLVNKQAETLSKQHCGIVINHSKLSAFLAKETELLQQLIRRACATQDGNARQGGSLGLSGPSLQLPLSVLITPLNSEDLPLRLASQRSTAAIFICDPMQQQEIPLEMLINLYGLSPAEARLAKGLAEGLTLDDIAASALISKNTARTQLRSIFQKTGLNRQTDLIKLIACGPAKLLR